MNDHEWSLMATNHEVTTNDNEWQQVTTNGNELLRKTTSDQGQIKNAFQMITNDNKDNDW